MNRVHLGETYIPRCATSPLARTTVARGRLVSYMQASLRHRHWADLLTELVSRDLKVRYQRSYIGIGWSLMKPLTQLVVFSIVFRAVLPLNIEHYTTFVFAGVLIWSWFSGGLTAGATSITDSKELARRPGFPVGLLPLLSVVSQGVHFMLALPLLLICATVDAGFPGASILALPIMIALQLLFMTGIAYLISASQVYFRDTEHLVVLGLSVAFYLTPVFYRPVQKQHSFSFLNSYNPVAWLLEGYRAILVHGEWPQGETIASVLAVSLALVAVGVAVFHRASKRFDEEL